MLPELGTYTVTILLKAQEQISGAVKKAAGAMKEMQKTTSSLSRKLSEVGKIATGFLGAMIGFDIFNRITDYVRESIDVEFERKSVELAALSKEAGQDVGLLAQAFRVVASAAAKDFAISGTQAMYALESLVKAGLSGKDAISALGAAIQMAKIEGSDFGLAANNLVQVLAQFNLTGKDAARVVDVLVNASNKGLGAASNFARGLGNCASTAKALGLSLEDTTTWLVLLEKRLGSAEEAGTHFNRFLLELYEIAEKLGVSIRDSNGALRDTNAIILDVSEAVKSTGGDFEALLKRLPGVDIRSLRTILYLSQTKDGFQELRKEVGKTGTAMEAFNEILDTSAGKMEQLRAENDRLQRRVGENFWDLYYQLSGPILTGVNAVFTAWNGIIAHFTGNVARNYESMIEANLMLGRVTEETAGKWIRAWVESGEITISEGLRIAEHLGILTDDVLYLIDVATKAGADVPQSFQNISTMLDNTKQKIEEITSSVKEMTSSFKLLSGAASYASQFYDVVLKVEQALGRDVQLSEAAKQSKERLAAVQDVLNFLTQSYTLVLQAMQLQSLGASDAGTMLMNTLTATQRALEDGIVTQNEFVEILKQMGIDAKNVSGSLHNILMKSLEATRKAILGNTDAVSQFIQKLKELDGMEAHTYHYHHIITIRETGTAGARHEHGITIREGEQAAPGLQFGAWYVHGGLYRLHRGEMVLPRSVAEWFRRGGGVAASQKTVNVTIGDIIVNYNGFEGIRDIRDLAEAISREMVRRWRAAL